MLWFARLSRGFNKIWSKMVDAFWGDTINALVKMIMLKWITIVMEMEEKTVIFPRSTIRTVLTEFMKVMITRTLLATCYGLTSDEAIHKRGMGAKLIKAFRNIPGVKFIANGQGNRTMPVCVAKRMIGDTAKNHTTPKKKKIRMSLEALMKVSPSHCLEADPATNMTLILTDDADIELNPEEFECVLDKLSDSKWA
eukprot:Gb_00806 [translate_table: standard]